MHRKFIALVVSAALAVTGMTTQPAQAGNDDVAKWIAGLAVLGIIGVAIAEENKKSSRPSYHPQNNYKALPARCLVTERLQGKKVHGFTRHCLKRNNVIVQNLPQHCALRIRDRHTGERRVIYTGKCLRKQGYSMAQARY